MPPLRWQNFDRVNAQSATLDRFAPRPVSFQQVQLCAESGESRRLMNVAFPRCAGRFPVQGAHDDLRGASGPLGWRPCRSRSQIPRIERVRSSSPMRTLAVKALSAPPGFRIGVR